MAEYFGKFSGHPKSEWLSEVGEDRRMRLLETFYFEDSHRKKWIAPQNVIVDGATIPAALWSIVGSPYTGDYRRAAVVHDVACADPQTVRAKADEMFYFACLAGGCSKRQARLLYLGVCIGSWAPGIRFWSLDDVHKPRVDKDGLSFSPTNNSIKNTFEEIAIELEAAPEEIEFNQIRQIVEKHLSTKASH